MKKFDNLKNIIFSNSVKAGLWYTVSNVLNKAIAFLAMPIFTRLLLPEEYGVVNTYMAWVAVITIFSGLCLHTPLLTAYKDFKENVEQFSSSSLFLSFLSFLTTSILVYGTVILLKVDMPRILVIFALIQSYAEFVILFYSQKLIMTNKYKQYSFVNSVVPIANVILSLVLIITVLKNNRAMGRIFSVFIVETIVAVILFILVLVKGKRLVEFSYWKYAIKYSLPLILHGGSLYILSQSDRLMISYFIGYDQTGIYSLMYNFGMIAQMVSTSLNNVWLPFFTDAVEKNDNKEIDKKAIAFMDVFAIITCNLVLISPEIIKFMAPPEYWSGISILAPIVISAFVVFEYTFSATTERYYKKTGVMSTCTIIAASVNVILNLIFIPRFGIVAAAYSTLIAYIVSAVIHYFVSRRCNNNFLNIKIFLKPIIIVLSVSIISLFTEDLWILRWLISILLTLLYGRLILKGLSKK